MKKEEVEASEGVKKPQTERTPGKSVSFLAGREEEMSPALLEALPVKVQGTTANYYSFWTYSHVHCDALDLIKAMMIQSVRTFGIALECQ